MEHKITETAAYLRERGISGPIEAAFVLGTGLGTLVEEVSNQTSLSYNEIPHFPQSGVSGHAGKLVAGTLEGKRVLLLQGRAHYYETGDGGAMRIPVGVIASLDIPVLILTNAAGSVRAGIRPGSLVSISDHINLAGANPLVGDTTERRFVSMTGAYDVGCAKCYSAPPQERGSQCRRVFIRGFRDPSFETPAEITMTQVLGGDLVGMSTVPEVILARYYGLRVAAISLVTNLAAGIEGASPSHQETKDTAADASTEFKRLVRCFIAELS